MSIMEKVMFWKREPDIGKFDMDRFKQSEAQMPPDNLGNFGQQGFGAQLGAQQGFGSSDLSSGFRPDDLNPTPSSFQAPPSANAISPMDTHHQEIVSKNIEVLSSKIDALRSTLESINIRLQNIERIAMQSEDDQRQRRW